jgi:hypothetical protein
VGTWIWTSSAGDRLTDPPTPPFQRVHGHHQGGTPTMLEIDGRQLSVIRVWDNWGVYEEGSGVCGTAWHVALEDGRALLVYRDLVNGGWFLAR